MKIFDVNFRPRGYWATDTEDRENTKVYNITQGGVVTLVFDLQDVNGNATEAVVDLAYMTGSEAKAFMSDKKVKKAMDAFRYAFIGRKIADDAIVGSVNKNIKRFTRDLSQKIRMAFYGKDQVVLTVGYGQKLASTYARQLKEGKVPKNSTFEELRDNPMMAYKTIVAKVTA